MVQLNEERAMSFPNVYSVKYMHIHLQPETTLKLHKSTQISE